MNMLDQGTLYAASWGNATALAKVQAAAVLALDPLPTDETLTATALMVRLCDPAHTKLCANALYHIRKLPAFAPYWQKSATARTRFKDKSGNRLATIEYLGQGKRSLAVVRFELERCPPKAKARAALERELQSLLSAEVF